MKEKTWRRILPFFSIDLESCVESTEGRLTKTKKKGSTRCWNLLEFIPFNYGPFPNTFIISSIISFNDDYFFVSTIILITDEASFLDVFNIQNRNRNLKRGLNCESDTKWEFCEKYDENGHIIGPFASYLQECDIIAQYMSPSTPKQNEWLKRK